MVLAFFYKVIYIIFSAFYPIVFLVIEGSINKEFKLENWEIWNENKNVIIHKEKDYNNKDNAIDNEDSIKPNDRILQYLQNILKESIFGKLANPKFYSDSSYTHSTLNPEEIPSHWKCSSFPKIIEPVYNITWKVGYTIHELKFTSKDIIEITKGLSLYKEDPTGYSSPAKSSTMIAVSPFIDINNFTINKSNLDIEKTNSTLGLEIKLDIKLGQEIIIQFTYNPESKLDFELEGKEAIIVKDNFFIFAVDWISINDLVLYIKSLTGGQTSNSNVYGNNVYDNTNNNFVKESSNKRKRDDSNEGEDDENNPHKKRANDLIIYEGTKINLKNIESLICYLNIFLMEICQLNDDGSFLWDNNLMQWVLGVLQWSPIFEDLLGSIGKIPDIKYDSTGTIQYQSNPPSDLVSLIEGLSLVNLIALNMRQLTRFFAEVNIHNIGIDTEIRFRMVRSWPTHAMYDSTRPRGNPLHFCPENEVPYYTIQSVRSIITRAIQFLNNYLNSCR